MTKGKDQYLEQRGENFRYVRMVPKSMHGLDVRAPKIKINLNTADPRRARAKRDTYRKADDRLWEALSKGMDAATARERYDAELALQDALEIERLPRIPLLNHTPEHRAALKAQNEQALTKLGANTPAKRRQVEEFNKPVMDAVFSRNENPADTVTDAVLAP